MAEVTFASRSRVVASTQFRDALANASLNFTSSPSGVRCRLQHVLYVHMPCRQNEALQTADAGHQETVDEHPPFA